MEANSQRISDEQKILVKFLKRTKDGEYANIYPDIISRIQLGIERLDFPEEDLYYYSYVGPE